MSIADVVRTLSELLGRNFRGRLEVNFPGNGTVASLHIHEVVTGTGRQNAARGAHDGDRVQTKKPGVVRGKAPTTIARRGPTWRGIRRSGPRSGRETNQIAPSGFGGNLGDRPRIV